MTPFSLKLLQSLQGWRGKLVSVVAGLMTPLAFAPLDWWPLAILGPALLFLLWLDASPRQAAVLGLLFGLGFFGIGINWVFISVHYYGYVDFSFSLVITAVLVFFMALFPALVGYTLTRFFPRNFHHQASRYKLLLAIPAFWVLGEWIRGWFMTGLPWLSLGYSQLSSPLAGLAPVFGVYGVSWVVALSSALVVAVLLSARQRWLYSAVLLLVWSGVWGLGLVPWTHPIGEPIKATLLQANIPQDLKWHPSMREPTIAIYAEMTRENWATSDLIIWPESAIPGFYHEVEGFLDELEVEAQEQQTDLLIGVLSMNLETQQYYNSMLSLGQSRGFYHKQHLVPFTEYLPLKNWLGGFVKFIQVPMSDFSPGEDDQPLLSVAGQKVGISICFDGVFGEELIRTLPQASLLVNVSNDAWFADSWAPPQHLQIAQMRALESGRYMLRATNTGVTAVVDEKGRITAQAPQFETTFLNAEAQPRAGTTPYVLWANTPVVLGSLALIVFTYIRLDRRKET